MSDPELYQHFKTIFLALFVIYLFYLATITLLGLPMTLEQLVMMMFIVDWILDNYIQI